MELLLYITPSLKFPLWNRFSRKIPRNQGHDIYMIFMCFTPVCAPDGILMGALEMLGKLAAFARCESGATAIEYGLIAAGISVAIIAVVNGLGTSLNAKFKSISTQLK